MRSLLTFLVAAAAATAQSPLTTTFANNNSGNLGGTVYFELTDLTGGGVTITSLDLNFTQAAGIVGGVDIYMAPPGTAHTDPIWVMVANGTGTAAGPGVPTPITLSNPIGIGPNSTWKFAIVAQGFAHAYTTATGMPSPLAQNADLALDSGSASNVPFNGGLFSPRLVNTNIYYNLGGSDPPIAKAVREGLGCIRRFASFYEVQSPTAFDLNNTQLEATWNGSGYVVIHNPVGVINPIGSIDPSALPLPLGDDVSLSVGNLGISVHSNGQVEFGTGNSTNWSPSPATMLSNPSAAIYVWTDLSPNLQGSGRVTYEDNPATGDYQVTYDGVYAFGTTDPSTFQIRGNVVTRNFQIAFGTMHTTGPEDILVGYSPMLQSADPGPTDLNSGQPIITWATDSLPLDLDPDVRPIQGASALPVTATCSNIPLTSVFHVGIIGLSNPGLPLSPIGFPSGCMLNANADLLVGPDVIIGQTTHTWTTLTIPAGAGLNGFEYFAQSVTLDLTLASPTARASNGIRYTIGDL